MHFGSPDAFNPLHSTDNGWQSLEYLHVLRDEALVARVEAAVEALVASMRSPWPVVRTLGEQGRRARVDVVAHPVHGESVFKIFRPGAHASWAREVAARAALGDSPLVPPLLESGEGWLLSRFYSDTGGHVIRRLPGSREKQLRFSDARKLRGLVDLLRSRGFYLLDLTTHNVVTDPVDGMKVLDLEFFGPYSGDVPELAIDCSVTGVPGEVGDPAISPIWPTRTTWHNAVTRSLFRTSITGVSVAALSHDSVLIRFRAGFVQLVWLAPFAAAAVAKRLLATRSATRFVALVRRVRG